MKGKTKMIVGIALVLGIASIAFLATPIQAYVNGTGDSDMLQTQDHDRLRTHDCDGDMLQKQDQARDRLRTQNCCGNRTANLEQYRYQYRDKEQATNIVP